MTDLYFDIKQIAEENKVANCDNLLLVPEKEKNEGSVTLLKAIIAALKLDLEQNFRLIWVPDSGYSAGRIFSSYQKILVLGCTADQLGLNFEEKKYRILQMEGQRLLFGDGPTTLSTDTAKKGLLWKSLQVMFDLVKP
ncbi:MAG: hypothetical protein IPJ54_13175 [Saprospiraceae bacterium]|nr:hypothetical protein [Saprospiraceae bacterium]HMT00614.1 hypothetical protein [Saprospiraceae bacterium]